MGKAPFGIYHYMDGIYVAGWGHPGSGHKEREKVGRDGETGLGATQCIEINWMGATSKAMSQEPNGESVSGRGCSVASNAVDGLSKRRSPD